jgi:hypothetical protein
MSFRSERSPPGVGNDLQASPLLDEQPLEEVLVLIARRWVTGIGKCAMQASKSSRVRRKSGASGGRPARRTVTAEESSFS